jgi:hypothetical protein
MRHALFLTAGLLASTWTSIARASDAFDFVNEYIRQLGALEEIRDNAEQELKAGSANQFADCIRNSTLFQLELRTDISQLQAVALPKPVADLPSLLVESYQQKLALYKQLSDTCSKMIAGPQPGVDYAQLAGDTPKITANLEYVDHTIFKFSPLVFATLIDQRPDKENHLSHLTITKAQRDSLVHDLNLSFGKKMDQENQNWGVSAASVLRTYLTEKGYKFADDPW